MKRIGLIGEDPNDTSSIQNLLAQKFKNELSFRPLLRNIKGYQLDNNSTERSLKVELRFEKIDLIIFIRDLDGFESEKNKVEKVENWFKKLNKISGRTGILLLNIYELEAMIFADIEIFNKIYKTRISNGRNVHFIKEPKEELKHKTYHCIKRYTESHCPDLFKKLRYENILLNSAKFREFENTFISFLKK